MAYAYTLPTGDQIHTFLCPNCPWRAEGNDIVTLRREKDAHALFECPLPASATNTAQKRAS